MEQPQLRAARKHGGRRLAALVALTGVVGVNLLTALQAQALTQYAHGEDSPPRLEAMSFAAKTWMLATGARIPRPENTATPASRGLAYHVQRIPVGSGESLEAWYIPRDRPRGIVLLFPAYATSKSSLLAPAAAFQRLGYDAFLVDFRGAGGSSGDSTTLGAREATDVGTAVNYVKQIWPGRPLVLYGVSMGAAAILHAVAQEGVRPAAVILESPFDRLLDTVRNRFRALGLPPDPAAEVLLFWGSLERGFDGFALNPVDDAPAITCPALLMRGDADTRVTAAETAAIFARLGGPKRLAGFPGAGHTLLIAEAPTVWARQVAGFLDRYGAP